MRHETLVRVDSEGAVVCPYHGRLALAAEYEPGRAPCGCIFERHGIMLRAVQTGERTFAAETVDLAEVKRG